MVPVWLCLGGFPLGNCTQCRRYEAFSRDFHDLLLGAWLVCALFLRPLVESLDRISLLFLVTGGVLYTVGAILYGAGRKVKYMHSIWHFFCVAGSFFHFLVIYNIAVV